MKVLFLFIALSSQAFAHWCELNIAPQDLVVSEDKQKDYVTNFEVDFNKIESGKRKEISGIEAMTWAKGPFAYLKIIDKKNKVESYAQYQKSQDEMVLSLSPQYQLKCLKTAPQEADIAVKSNDLTEDTLLSRLPSGLTLRLKKELYLYFIESNSGKRMESLFWQNGKKVSKFSLDDNEDWCNFQIQVKVDEDVALPEGLKAPVISSNFSNNVLSLSLVDFEQAKIKTQTKRYALFQMECKFKNQDAVFKNWKSIVGADWEILK